MSFEKPEEPLPPADASEQITAEFPVYLDPDGDEVVVDDVPGRSGDALGDLKRRIRDTTESAGRS